MCLPFLLVESSVLIFICRVQWEFSKLNITYRYFWHSVFTFHLGTYQSKVGHMFEGLHISDFDPVSLTRSHNLHSGPWHVQTTRKVLMKINTSPFWVFLSFFFLILAFLVLITFMPLWCLYQFSILLSFSWCYSRKYWFAANHVLKQCLFAKINGF